MTPFKIKQSYQFGNEKRGPPARPSYDMDETMSHGGLRSGYYDASAIAAAARVILLTSEGLENRQIAPSWG